jgi:hypothetical protein
MERKGKMKLKMLGLAILTTGSVVAYAAPSASATTLEVSGVTINQAGTITVSLASGESSITARTDGSLANTCTGGHLHGATQSPFTGKTVTAPLSSAEASNCTRPATVHKPGIVHIEKIAGTTNGTVSSSGAQQTVGSPFGTLNCQTGAGIDIGTLTGAASGHATIDINAVMGCGFLVPSMLWKTVLTVTSPTGLGVSA